jgi:hypothetical protein
MRRFGIASALALALAFGTVGIAAAKSDDGCSNTFAPIALYTGWHAGDGVPDPGVDAWWDMTVEAFAQAGLTVEEAAALYGFEGDVDGFYEVILGGILSVDRNGDGTICFKAFPAQQNGHPGYIFKVQDDA